MPKTITHLAWDSDFFGKKIGKIKLDRDETISDIDLISDNYDLLYIYTPHELLVGNPGLHLADRKRSYILDCPKCKSSIDHNVTEFIGEPSALYNLAIQSGHKSRFNIDPNFSNEEFVRFYKTWVDNSLNHSFADFIYVYNINGIPCGFITAQKKESVISIGLFATDIQYRNKGLGSALINKITQIAAIDNLSVEVTTQADNVRACKFYEHKGFRVSDESLVYHLWMPSNKL